MKKLKKAFTRFSRFNGQNGLKLLTKTVKMFLNKISGINEAKV